MNTVIVESGQDEQGARPPRRRPFAPLAGVVLLFVVAILAAAVAGHPSFRPAPEQTAPILPEPRPPAPTDGALPGDLVGGGDLFLKIIGIVLVVIAIAVAVLVLVWVVRAVLAAWRERPLRRQAPVATDLDAAGGDAPAEPEPDAPVVRRGIAAARAAIDARTDPSDAIVAAWLGLEETAADSGAGRASSETQVEFTLRMLLHRPGIEEPARRLLGLYEGVRYAGRTAGEQERSAAAEALARIEDGWSR
ncbi:DUF4129 domain-containing protein [Microbacterium soli]|uniref:Protein-glutamine gamma-glutamyltransferase-like C-terminal domain-containing protein n=1 Tax=Microbacterium soli TaxID=446075 RepID=A0ABP7NGA6_9MICO